MLLSFWLWANPGAFSLKKQEREEQSENQDIFSR